MFKKTIPPNCLVLNIFTTKKAAVVSNFCLIGKILHDFLIPTMIELGCKTFMPFQTSGLHRVHGKKLQNATNSFFNAIILVVFCLNYKTIRHQTNWQTMILLHKFVLGFNDNITHHNNVLVLVVYLNNTFTTDSIKWSRQIDNSWAFGGGLFYLAYSFRFRVLFSIISFSLKVCTYI